jgi:hypothetical protein
VPLLPRTRKMADEEKGQNSLPLRPGRGYFHRSSHLCISKRRIVLPLICGTLLLTSRTFVSNAGGEWKEHTSNNITKENTRSATVSSFQNIDDETHLQCATLNNSWHLAFVWGHGVANYSDILSIIQDTLPDIRIPYQKFVHNFDLGGLVNVTYSDDIARIGKEFIDAKAGYLNSVPNTLAVLILDDPAPLMQSYGAITANSRLVDVKWDIRQRFNPKLSEDAQRDSHGVFSHHHVIHITDSSDGVDDVLQYLGQPSIAQLNRTGSEISIPWHFGDSSRNYPFAVEEVLLTSLKIRCAVSRRKCTKGFTIPIFESPHYAFATGKEEEYVEYYLEGRSEGVLTDDHTPLAFTRLKERFNPQQYPLCLCESDGILRRSMLIVDAENIILDGAHRAALLLAGVLSETVLVARWGAHGAKAEPCVVKDRVKEIYDESPGRVHPKNGKMVQNSQPLIAPGRVH